MLYLSIALVSIAIILVTNPPTIVFHKIIEVRTPPMPAQPVEISEEDIKTLQDNAPPTLDNMMDALNLALHDISGGDLDD